MAKAPWSADILRSLGAHFPEIAEEAEVLAAAVEASLEGPMTTEKLRRLNVAWTRGARWCKEYDGRVVDGVAKRWSMP